MKYKAEIILYANFTITADSEDDAHNKVINSELEWYINSHPEWDMNNKISPPPPLRFCPIKINKIEEVA